MAGITPCCCAAIAVLWMALAPERFPLQADTFSCAAGTAGKQKWSLILPSSARVSELTYVTIIGTRYPELDNVQNDIIQFGNYLQAEQCTRGGFIPIFWNAPYSYIQACTSLEEKFGRLVGATELEKGPASQTKLDIVPGYCSSNECLHVQWAHDEANLLRSGESNCSHRIGLFFLRSLFLGWELMEAFPSPSTEEIHPGLSK